ncbi:MAG: hypothetical protein MUC92_05160 [Fimbriimonadaceae bacterium]|jgi:hypothetical protein|nr:hypothetical protein [Fimbriimonadaceae bacterium]
MVFSLVASVCLLQVPSRVTYDLYQNARFGFRCDVPTFLIPQEPSANGDGRTFLSRDKKISLLVFANVNPLDEGIKEFHSGALANLRDKKVSNLTAQQKSDWSVVSYEEAGKIHYVRTWIRPRAKSVLQFEYPAEVARAMSPVVTRVSRSFRPATGD